MHILLPPGSRVCAFALLIAVFHVVSHGQQPQATIPTAQPADALRQYEEASRLYDQRQYDKAIELATNAAALLPKNYLPWALIGDCYVAQQKMKSASQAFAKSVEINPFAEKVWYWKAYADRERSAREESVAAAKEAIFLDEKYAAAYEIMGEALSLGNYDTKGAIEAFRTAVKLKPDLIVASEHLGSELSISGDEKGAEEVFRKAMEIDPQKMACRFELGRSLVRQGRLADARELWNGRKYDEENTFPLFITVLERAEKKKAAEDKLAASPNDPNALLEMGFAEMEGDNWNRDGRQKRALEYFRKALDKNPDLVRAQYGICKALVEIAYEEKSANKDVDRELKKLEKIDSALAAEIVEYRKKFVGALVLTGNWGTLDH